MASKEGDRRGETVAESWQAGLRGSRAVPPPDTPQSPAVPGGLLTHRPRVLLRAAERGLTGSQRGEGDSPFVPSPRTWLFMLMSVENSFLLPGARTWADTR